MGRSKYILVVLLLISLIVGSGCTPWWVKNNPTPAGVAINPEWQPLYIDEEAGTPLPEGELVETIAPTVVSVFAEKTTYDFFRRPETETSAGSGVIIDPKGYIVTNRHVVEEAENVTVVLADGEIFEAFNWVTDPWTDLAVVQIEPHEDLPFAHFLRNSLQKLRVWDDEVAAVGNAYALPGGPSWTGGRISYLGRSIELDNGVVLYDLIQTDAAINPGNSGGPLVNMAGQVVGINTAIIKEAENIGFAISTNTVIPVIKSLVEKGKVVHTWLGVIITNVTPAIKAQYNLSVDYGALVVDVFSGDPADKAGLRTGDVIVNFDGQAISTREQLGDAIGEQNPGDTVTITFIRDGEERTTTATLVQRSPP